MTTTETKEDRTRRLSRERQARWRERNRDKDRERTRQWALDNPERAAAHKRKWRLKKEYGLTLEEYEQLLGEQGGVCALCGFEPEGTLLHVDHCHDGGQVRGLLCVGCNTALRTPDWHQRAIAYLEGGLSD